MVNRSAKGTAIELRAIKILEGWGYKVHRCVRTGVKRGALYFSQSNDVFGCIDLVAKKRGERTRWVQVTSHSGIGAKKADLGQVPWDPLFDQVEIWRWVGGASRRHKTTGASLDRQYFQVYKAEEDFDLRADNRIRATDGPDDAGAPDTAHLRGEPDQPGASRRVPPGKPRSGPAHGSRPQADPADEPHGTAQTADEPHREVHPAHPQRPEADQEAWA